MLIYIILALCFGCVLCEYHCYYLDKFEKRQQVVCDTSCCGDVHLAYCCQKNISAIILGITGCVILLLVITAISIHVYRRRCRRHHIDVTSNRNYGSIDTPGNNETDREQLPADPESLQEVECDVTSTQAELHKSRELKF